jgi:hypothetical protein
MKIDKSMKQPAGKLVSHRNNAKAMTRANAAAVAAMPAHEPSASDDPNEPIVEVRRQWNDYRIGRCRLNDVEGLHWSDYGSGGFYAPQLHGYVFCDQIVGEIGHSCQHGPPPHRIKVCITKRGNEAIWPAVLDCAGPKR